MRGLTRAVLRLPATVLATDPPGVITELPA
ncbi:hypothetical protein F4554_001596 [Actinopolymorpha rutila]|uniref:Uncharacterized protein n=1 Tax=Actinopolymorpha rutila TaxID=446787 RepID=A0A852ZB32_9ACTN|nr:hypothetical protein [Actinopolymorpha rutila]